MRTSIDYKFDEVMNNIKNNNNIQVIYEKSPWHKRSELHAIKIICGVFMFRVLKDKAGIFFPLSIKLEGSKEEFYMMYGDEDSDYAGVLVQTEGIEGLSYKRMAIHVLYGEVI